MQRKLILASMVVAAAVILMGAATTSALTLSTSAPQRASRSAGNNAAPAASTVAATFTPFIATVPPASPTAAPAAATVTPTAYGADQRSASAASVRGASLPLPSSINGVSIDQIVVMPDAVRQNVRQLFAKGVSLGRNPRAFVKVGDSTMVWPPFLVVFDNPRGFKLGAYAGLQPAIDYLADSFSRPSIAVQKNMHSWGQFDVALADKSVCNAGEGPLACEVRLWNPTLVIIRLGVNDALVPDALDKNLRRIIEYCTERGIVPVLGTKPDRMEGPDNTINKLIQRLATSYNIPLWDYDLIAGSVPGKGLDQDNMHFLNGGLRDFSSAATLQTADALEDLTGLILLHTIYHEVKAIQ